jgi:hypothetical protein
VTRSHLLVQKAQLPNSGQAEEVGELGRRPRQLGQLPLGHLHLMFQVQAKRRSRKMMMGSRLFLRKRQSGGLVVGVVKLLMFALGFMHGVSATIHNSPVMAIRLRP